MSVDINCPRLLRVIQNANDLSKTSNCPPARQNISGVKYSRFLFSKEKASNSPVTVTSPCFQTVLSNQHNLGSSNYTIGNNTSTVKVQPDTPMSLVQWFLGFIFPKTSHGSNRCFCLVNIHLRSQGIDWTFYLVCFKYQGAALSSHGRSKFLQLMGNACKLSRKVITLKFLLRVMFIHESSLDHSFF